MGKRRCRGCGGPVAARFQWCSEDCKPRCSIEGCTSPRRKNGWCASHYAQAQKSGEPPQPFKYKWADRIPCVVCGKPSTDHYRRFCSSACYGLSRSMGGQRPRVIRCAICEVEIDLMARGRKGQRRKVTTKLCRRCKSEYSKYGMTVADLVVRDGTDCGICGDPVDLSLRRSDGVMCASIDHVLPRALGGTHHPENLQLAHLRCNQVKSDLRGQAV